MYPFSLGSPELPRAIFNVSHFLDLSVTSYPTGDMMSLLSLVMHLMVGRYGDLESAIALFQHMQVCQTTGPSVSPPEIGNGSIPKAEIGKDRIC